VTSPRAVLTRNERGVLHVTLNRPEVKNAMNLEMVRELGEALTSAEADPSVRVVVLRGAGGHFCSGGDIRDFARARSEDAGEGGGDPIARVNAAFGRLCLGYARTTLPVVAVLEGAVMGGGFGLACVADVAIAAASAVFRLPETSLGVVPAQIAPFLVERLGYSEAKRLAVTGGKLSAEEALAVRLVHEVSADAAALESALLRTLTKILACAPKATAATKALVGRARTEPAEALIDDAAAIFSSALSSDEGAEGTLAFMQKRLPAWAVPGRGPGRGQGDG
jgi:isohexenylglutaconyl-CoA hydratase